MADDCTCDNSKKHEAQLIDVLVSALRAPQSEQPRQDFYRILYGPEGELNGGLIGEINSLDKTVAAISGEVKSMRNWIKIGVTVNLFLLSILTAHLADSPKTALADTPKPAAIEQPLEVPTDGAEITTLR